MARRRAPQLRPGRRLSRPGHSESEPEVAPPQNGTDSRRKPLIWFAAAIATAVLGWAVTYFAPGAWEGVKRLGDETDLRVSVLFSEQFDSPAEADSSGQFIWPMPAREIPEDATPAVTRTRGAADAESTLIRINVRGTSTKRVTVQRVEVVTVRRDRPLRGVWRTGDQGGVVTVRYLTANLDTGQITWSDDTKKPIGPIAVYVTDTEEETSISSRVRRSATAAGTSGSPTRSREARRGRRPFGDPTARTSGPRR